jgi:uncharacterized protein with FMN-binding domain
MMPDVLKNRRIARMVLSTGFMLASGAYAFWQHLIRLDAVAPPPAIHSLSRPLPQPLPSTPKLSEVPLSDMAGPSVSEAVPQGTHPARSVTALVSPPALPRSGLAKPKIEPPVADSAAPIAPPPLPASPYRDGEFIGEVVDSYYGPIQVRVTIFTGDIVNADTPVYPNHFQRSDEISHWAIPELVDEVIKAQSADIDIVSGATQTSVAYYNALVSALEKAKK